MLDMESVPAPYQEVQPHWFFCRRAEDNTSWLPFSREDSDKLESAHSTGKNNCLHLTYTLCNVYVNYVDSDTQGCQKQENSESANTRQETRSSVVLG